MTLQVLDSKDNIEALTTGVIPVPVGIAEDNAAQAAKREHGKDKGDDKPRVQAPKDKESDSPAVQTGAEGAEPAPEADDIEGEDGLTPRQKREFTKAMLATVGKKHRKMMEAEEFAADQYRERTLAEGRARDLERENARLKEAGKPIAPIEVKAPDRKDFESDAAYADALIDYRVDQKLATKAAEDAKQREIERQENIRQTAAQRIATALELVPDFAEVTEAVDQPVPPVIANYMQKSPLFAELGYYFGKNPEVLAALSKLPSDEQLVEIGEIKSTLKPFAPAAKENGAEPSKTNGTKPSTETGDIPSKPRVIAPVIRPLSGGSAAQVEKPEGEKSLAEVRRDYERKHGVKFLARKRH